ncbi:hypothetical protein [Micromonospora sp. CA-246542]|uniref:hypothetical protein n=1 Tax=Micromonospora sp. CA-246542 TaxID=3239959 RepID=UPI003D91DF48
MLTFAAPASAAAPSAQAAAGPPSACYGGHSYYAINGGSYSGSRLYEVSAGD